MPSWGERPGDDHRGIVSGQLIGNAIDDNPSTQYNDPNANDAFGDGDFLLVYAYANQTAYTVTSYTLTNGNNADDDPISWTLSGSSDFGHSWTLLDSETNVSWTSRGQKQAFSIANPGAYNMYKFDASQISDANTGNGGCIVAEYELLDSTGHDTTDDQAGCLTGRAEDWGQCELLNESYVAKSTVPTPTSVALPPPPPNNNRTIYDVQQNTGNDAQAIQTQINNAVNGGTTRPVVHIPMGTYSIAQTITVPANFDIQIVGDGGTMEATQLN